MISSASRLWTRIALGALLVSLSGGLFAAAVNSNYPNYWGDDVRPSVTAAGTGVWVSVWETTASLGVDASDDWDIAVGRSTDNGKTWSIPKAIASEAFTDSADDTHAKVAQGTTGTLVCVWQSGVAGGERDIRFVRSTDGGQSWSSPAALNSDASTDTRDDQLPALSSDGKGNWMVVWSGAAPGEDYELYFSRSTDNGMSWSAPALLNDNAASDEKRNDLQASVSGQSNGTWMVFWAAGNCDDTTGTADLVYARSANFGGSWSSPVTLQSGGDFSTRVISPDLACDGQGTWVATWTSGDRKLARSTDDGLTWQQTTLGEGVYPKVVSEGAGLWMLAWRSWNKVYSVCSADNAQSWNIGYRESPSGSEAVGDPAWQIASDGSGNVNAVWGTKPGFADDWDIVSSLISTPSTPQANLYVEMTMAEGTVCAVGQSLKYYVTVKNAGPDVARGVVLKETVWQGGSIVSVQPGQGSATSVTNNEAYVELGDMNPGQVIVTVRVKGLQVGLLTHTSEVASSTNDPYPFYNTSGLFGAIQVRGATDLQMSMTASAPSIGVGEKMTFALTVTNNGPSKASSVVVKDDLPCPGAIFSDASAGQGTIGITGTEVSWDVGALAPGQSATANISVTGFGFFTLINTATAYSNVEVETDWANNIASVTYSTGGADLSGSWKTLSQRTRTSRRGTSYQLKGSFEVKNTGNVNSQPTAVAFYLSDDKVFDGTNTNPEYQDKFISQVNVGKLRAGQASRRNIQLTLDQSASGKYIIAVIDPQASVPEVVEQNNTVAGGPVQ